jgi:hypothetical protein
MREAEMGTECMYESRPVLEVEANKCAGHEQDRQQAAVTLRLEVLVQAT